MADMNIRNIGDALLKKLKVGAAEAGITLRQYVIERLEENGKSGRVSDVPRAEAMVPSDRRESSARKPMDRGAACKHGAAPGFCKHGECNK